MDDLVRRIGKLAKGVAAQQYSPEVEAILKVRSCGSGRIERCLDDLLDFCFDGMLVLYKKLCRQRLFTSMPIKRCGMKKIKK